MRFALTARFKRDYRKAATDVQERTDKALKFLLSDLQHPSLRAKIVDERRRIWQARVSDSWRIQFQIADDSLLVLQLFSHKD